MPVQAPAADARPGTITVRVSLNLLYFNNEFLWINGGEF